MSGEASCYAGRKDLTSFSGEVLMLSSWAYAVIALVAGLEVLGVIMIVLASGIPIVNY